MAVVMVVVVIIAIAALTPSHTASSEERKMFAVVESYSNGCVLLCTETGVLYWESQGQYNRGVLTLLVDEQGKPMTWHK